MDLMNWKNRTKYRGKYINPMIETGVIKMTYPNLPKSPNQQYYLSEKGQLFLELLSKKLI